MSFIPVMEYLAGIFVFGFVKLIFNDVIDAVKVVSATGDVYDLGEFLWVGIVIVYIVGGAIYLWLTYTRPAYQLPWDYSGGRY